MVCGVALAPSSGRLDVSLLSSGAASLAPEHAAVAGRGGSQAAVGYLGTAPGVPRALLSRGDAQANRACSDAQSRCERRAPRSRPSGPLATLCHLQFSLLTRILYALRCRFEPAMAIKNNSTKIAKITRRNGAVTCCSMPARIPGNARVQKKRGSKTGLCWGRRWHLGSRPAAVAVVAVVETLPHAGDAAPTHTRLLRQRDHLPSKAPAQAPSDKPPTHGSQGWPRMPSR